jgi:hypothetical protein
MQSMRSIADDSMNVTRITSNVTRLSKRMQVIAILAIVGVYIVLGQGRALALSCFSGNNLPCGNGDPAQSGCNLSSPVSGMGTCRAYRTFLTNACASTNAGGDSIGSVSFTLVGPSTETWVCTVQANLRITQGSTAGNWTFETSTVAELPPAMAGSPPTIVNTGSFGGSFGPLQLAANASDLRQASGMAWGPQIGPFVGGQDIIITVDGGDDQSGAVFDRVNINAMCCQGF